MAILERLSRDECRFPFLSPAELKARLERAPVLYLPIGSLEWHNEHLPLGTDTFHAIELCHRLAEEIGGVVLPGFWWNTGGAHDHFCTYHMDEDLYRATLRNVCRGLRPIPARVLVLCNGHGGTFQHESPPIVADGLAGEGFPMKVLVADPYRLGADAACRIDHADTNETSVSLDLIPQLVRMDRPISADIMSGKTPFAGGQPSAKHGHTLWEAFRRDAIRLIQAALAP
jgi:creatinine amidohydrolase